MMNLNKIVILCTATILLNQILVASQYHCDIICGDEEGGRPSSTVCASDGVTYASLCEYNNAACRARQNHTTLYMQYYGKCITMATPCSELNHTRCPTSAHANACVCGSDGRTYTSECSLAAARCRGLQAPNAMEIELAHYGHCEHITNASRLVDCSQYFKISRPAIAIEGGSSLRLEQLRCNNTASYICGLDGNTYSNECSFCHTYSYRHTLTPSNMTVYISHDGYCRHYTIFG